MDNDLREIMEYYVSGLLEIFQGLVEGVYLTGSIALGAYHKGKSDIDFTTVLSRKLQVNEMKDILSLHKRIESLYPKLVMEGHYVTADVLGKLPSEIEPVPVYYEGALNPMSYEGINLVTWFTLKKYGVTLYGMPSSHLDFDVDINLLKKKMHENLNTYWVNWNNRTRKLLSLNGLSALCHESIEWGVLGISRLYYTFMENDIASKNKAGEYALSCTPPTYTRIIKEALRVRKGTVKRNYFSVLKRRRDAIRYIDYMIQECNRICKGGL